MESIMKVIIPITAPVLKYCLSTVSLYSQVIRRSVLPAVSPTSTGAPPESR